ncbi:hypothetical protein BJ741DRAFT_618422 [Chytriomyces cf. hyalinus JEL632]|nr:hypothetical protein BJ741DRAFT_618422 [Chytriomyces cf. hyalinus JEL632]
MSDTTTPAVEKKKRVGRRLDDSAPASRQQELNRANGRKFRERQKQQLTSLEMQVQEFHQLTDSLRTSLALVRKEKEDLKDTIHKLEHSNSLLVMQQQQQQQQQQQHNQLMLVGSSPCFNCAAEALKAQFFHDENIVLKAKLAAQTKEFESYFGQPQQMGDFEVMFDDVVVTPSPPAAAVTAHISQVSLSFLDSNTVPQDPPSTVGSVLSDDWMDVFGFENITKTAEQMYGPLKVEFARYSLNLIPLVKGNHHVNIILDSLVAASRTNDPSKVRKLLTRSFAAKHKLFTCPFMHPTQTTRRATIDILSTLQNFNTQHLDYMLSLISDKHRMEQMFREPCRIHEGIGRTQEALKAVPSLSGAHQVIDEYAIIASQPFISPELFLELRQRIEKIERWCLPGSEDAKRVEDIFVTHRRENKALITKRLEESMRDLDLS